MTEVIGTTYMDFVKVVSSFVSLDISVKSTGWVKWLDGKLTYGTYSIKAGSADDVGRRREFRDFVKGLCGADHFDFLFVEDVIGSINFKTAKILYQLNAIPDDMIGDGLISVGKVYREGNKVWKKSLKDASSYAPEGVEPKDDKQIIRDCLLALQFGDGTTSTIAEDVYDALGMAVGSIYSRIVMQQGDPSLKLHRAITSGYNVKQFADEFEALDYANSLNREITPVDFRRIRRDLKLAFKDYIDKVREDRATFVITIPTPRIGALALEKDFNLAIDTSYLVVYLKKR